MFQNVRLMLTTPLRGTLADCVVFLMKNYLLVFSIKISVRLSGSQNEKRVAKGEMRTDKTTPSAPGAAC